MDANTALTTVESQKLIAGLPRLTDLQQDLMSVITSYGFDQRSRRPLVPASWGRYGPLVNSVQEVAKDLIWADRDLYVHGERDEAMLKDIHLLTAQANRTGVKMQEKVVHRLYRPLLLTERLNPADANLPVHQRQCLMLFDGLVSYYQALSSQEWTHIEAIVFPPLTDYDLRRVGLELRVKDSSPAKWEVIRTWALMRRDYREGRHAPDSPPPPNATRFARDVGVDRTYATKCERAFLVSAIDEAFMKHRVNIHTAIVLSQRLASWPTILPNALDFATERNPTDEALNLWIDNHTALIKLSAGQSSPPTAASTAPSPAAVPAPDSDDENDEVLIESTLHDPIGALDGLYARLQETLHYMQLHEPELVDRIGLDNFKYFIDRYSFDLDLIKSLQSSA